MGFYKLNPLRFDIPQLPYKVPRVAKQSYTTPKTRPSTQRLCGLLGTMESHHLLTRILNHRCNHLSQCQDLNKYTHTAQPYPMLNLVSKSSISSGGLLPYAKDTHANMQITLNHSFNT